MAHGSAGLKAATVTRGDAMARQRRTGREALMRRRRRRDWCEARRDAGDGDGDMSGAAQPTATATARGGLEMARRRRRDMMRRRGSGGRARRRRRRRCGRGSRPARAAQQWGERELGWLETKSNT
uniref:Uncharacterized protein n=1 Tax=Oryza rufipogon TaxID=4529 RepID=A0A0E0NJH0_ORYRU